MGADAPGEGIQVTEEIITGVTISRSAFVADRA